ncbi:MAG: cytochrome oxidase small assembly protein [Caldimonas sp.]
MTTEHQQKKANLRLALVLATIALVFFLGFVARKTLFVA